MAPSPRTAAGSDRLALIAKDKQLLTQSSRTPRSIAFILKGYPRLSETFIAQEINALERRGFDICIVALRRPTDPMRHPVHHEIRAPILYLPEYLHREPMRVLRGWRVARRLEGYRTARGAWLRDLARDPTPNRVRRFGQALVLAGELPSVITSLHAHFLHTPASVARYAALLRGLPWTASAHAKDIWTTSEWDKREKLAECRWMVTCTASGHAHLSQLAPPGRVELIYHGLDLTRFAAPSPKPQNIDDGGGEARGLRILSVGRAVAKKGYDDLLAALAFLPHELRWHFVHIGDGILINRLKAAADRLGISSRIEWRGPQPQDVVLEAYRAADIFVLASRVTPDGDRDGLPNVLMEAQSQGLACIASDLPGIRELIEDGVTGLLVPARLPKELAAALETLIRDPARRRAIADACQQRVRRQFCMDDGIARLARKLAEV
jgi:glycosyltransferase involved in cell wall biosynthesis